MIIWFCVIAKKSYRSVNNPAIATNVGFCFQQESILSPAFYDKNRVVLKSVVYLVYKGP